MNCFYLRTFYSVLAFSYFQTIINFYSHSDHYCYDCFCFYCFCHCHYYFFICNVFNFYFSSFSHSILSLFISNIFKFKTNDMTKTLFKVGIKDTEAISVTLMGTLNIVCLTYSSDDLLLKWHCYILPLTIISFILWVFFNLYLLYCRFICILVYNFIIHWQSFWKEENICNLNKFCVFFYLYIFQCAYSKLAFFTYIYIYVHIYIYTYTHAYICH